MVSHTNVGAATAAVTYEDTHHVSRKAQDSLALICFQALAVDAALAGSGCGVVHGRRHRVVEVVWH